MIELVSEQEWIDSITPFREKIPNFASERLTNENLLFLVNFFSVFYTDISRVQFSQRLTHQLTPCCGMYDDYTYFLWSKTKSHQVHSFDEIVEIIMQNPNLFN